MTASCTVMKIYVKLLNTLSVGVQWVYSGCTVGVQLVYSRCVQDHTSHSDSHTHTHTHTHTHWWKVKKQHQRRWSCAWQPKSCLGIIAHLNRDIHFTCETHKLIVSSQLYILIRCGNIIRATVFFLTLYIHGEPNVTVQKAKCVNDTLGH